VKGLATACTMMATLMIPRKPLAVPVQAHVKELEAVNPTNDRPLRVPGYAQEGSSTVTANLDWKAPPDRQKFRSKHWLCFDSGTHTSTAYTSESTLSLRERFSHTLYTLIPPHQRYFHNHISRRTLLIMLAITSTCLLTLIVGLAAGLPTTSK
jgi:hypothetical protein